MKFGFMFRIGVNALILNELRIPRSRLLSLTKAGVSPLINKGKIPVLLETRIFQCIIFAI
jgi:hypothetical protein